MWKLRPRFSSGTFFSGPIEGRLPNCDGRLSACRQQSHQQVGREDSSGSRTLIQQALPQVSDTKNRKHRAGPPSSSPITASSTLPPPHPPTMCHQLTVSSQQLCPQSSYHFCSLQYKDRQQTGFGTWRAEVSTGQPSQTPSRTAKWRHLVGCFIV